jgi:hypothetical protein
MWIAVLIASCGRPEPAEHRAQSVECAQERPTPGIPDPGEGECASHDDCIDGVEGRCSAFEPYDAEEDDPWRLSCTYHECLSDDDCGKYVCDCRTEYYTTSVNRCLTRGNCQTDADCGNDYCSLSWDSCSEKLPYTSDGYFCHTARDKCRDHGDCERDEYCGFAPDQKRWVCRQSAYCAPNYHDQPDWVSLE